jgi:two-component system, OmpR family, response regulator
MEATILLVEDDEPSRQALTVALSRAGHHVVALGSGLELDATLATTAPDLALLDLRLAEGPNGFELARRIRDRSNAAIIFLSAAAELEDRLTGFRTGADDYVVKPVSVAELMARIDAVLRRTNRSEQGLVAADLTIDPIARRATRGAHELRLTMVEFSLLSAFVRKANQVLSKQQLLRDVWGFDQFDPNLVEVYVSSLRRKLEAHGPRLIVTVRGAGYVLRA